MTECPITTHDNIDRKNDLIHNIILKEKIWLHNNEMKINLNLSIAKRQLTMIIDTGANLTIVSEEVIKDGTLYCPEMKCSFSGINGIDHKFTTKGLTSGIFKINNYNLEHNIQVVDTSMKLNSDGIISVDFLKKFGAKINLIDDEIEFRIPINNENVKNKV